jgi:endonuclease III
VKAPEKLRALTQVAARFGRRWSPVGGLSQEERKAGYPASVLDLIVFHKLHLSLSAASALRSYRALKERFVDWNEVRISSVREIQEALSTAEGSLDLAVFVKDLLELIHRERQDLNLEFLVEENHGEIRRFLKQVRGLDSSTVELVLRQRKEHPVLPLNPALEIVLERLGVCRVSDTLVQKEKQLHELVGPEKGLLVHHFLLDHSLRVCPPEEESVDCPSCGFRSICAFYARSKSGRGQKNSSRRADLSRSPSSAHRSSTERRGPGARKSSRGSR